MKFSIVKTTSDDEHSRYLVAIESLVLVGQDKDKIEFFKFNCGESDIKMMKNVLTLEIRPHPQKKVKGCPCLGFRTCDDCADNYRQLLKRSIPPPEQS